MFDDPIFILSIDSINLFIIEKQGPHGNSWNDYYLVQILQNPDEKTAFSKTLGYLKDPQMKNPKIISNDQEIQKEIFDRIDFCFELLQMKFINKDFEINPDFLEDPTNNYLFEEFCHQSKKMLSEYKFNKGLFGLNPSKRSLDLKEKLNSFRLSR